MMFSLVINLLILLVIVYIFSRLIYDISKDVIHAFKEDLWFLFGVGLLLDSLIIGVLVTFVLVSLFLGGYLVR